MTFIAFGRTAVILAVVAVLLLVGGLARGSIPGIIAGGILGVLSVLLYFAHVRQVERAEGEAQAMARHRQTRQAAGRPQPEALPADGTLPERGPGETEAQWAGRIQAAEAAAFRARTKI
jgi:hypothetical protein